MASPSRIERSLHEPLLLTAFSASNIHCSSCVSYIEQVLAKSSVAYAIISTNISPIHGQIQILHKPELPIKVVGDEISEAAFEVRSAITIDENDNVVSELAFEHNDDGLFQDVAKRVRTSFQQSPIPRSSWNLSTPLRNKRKRHVQNCQACQNNEKHQVFQPSTPTRQTKIPMQSTTKSIATPMTTSSTTSSLTRALNQAFDSPSPCPEKATQTPQVPTAIPQQWTTEMSISGMTCSACTNAVTDALVSLNNVNSVRVALMTNSAVIIFTGTKSYEDILRTAVEDVGFEVTGITTTQQKTAWPSRLHRSNGISGTDLSRCASIDSDATVHRNTVDDGDADDVFQASFSISGMTCSACSNSVIDVLTGLPFVESATVSLMTNSADVVFQRRESVDEVVNAVEDMGFDCFVEPDSITNRKPSVASTTEDQEKELPTSRSLQVKVEGFYCVHCPERVVDNIQRIYGDSIHIDKAPTSEDPIVTLSYIPDLASDFSARSIVRTIQLSDTEGRFKASIYHPPSVEEKSRQVQRAERRKLLLRLLASVTIVIPTFIIGVVCMSLLPAENTTRRFFMALMWAGQVPRAEWALFFLATPVYFFVADVFHKRAIKEIRALWRPKSRVPIHRRFIRFGSMNLLVSAGTTVAYVASLGVMIMTATTPMPNQDSPSMPGMKMDERSDDTSNSTYFDMVVFLTFFILIGRYLEAYSKAKAGDAVSMLSNLRPEDTIVFESNGDQLSVPTDQLEIGDTILVRYGESPAADGILLDAEGRFDESSLTGESKPARKTQGEKVFTGTINLGSPARIKVIDTNGTSMLDQIIAVVREGQVRRAPVEQIADIITGYFVPVITALAILTFVIWISLGYSGALDRKYLHNQQGGWAFWSLEFAIAVFVVACPCGIGLAAPTALFVGGGLAAKHGILARGGGQAFQDAGNLSAIIFDKTGTLTEGGDLKVTDLKYLGSDDDEKTLMAIAHKLEVGSSHPVAAAIAAKAFEKSEDSTTQLDGERLEEIPGNGIEGTWSTSTGIYTARIGSARFIAPLSPIGLHDQSIQNTITSYEQQAKTVALFATRFTPHGSDSSSSQYHLTAIFAIEDAIRPSAAPAVAALTRRGLDVYMVSGDNATTAHSVAARVGIKPENVFAGVLPTEKAQTIELLREKFARKAPNKKSVPAGPLRRVFLDQGAIREQEDTGSAARPSGDTVDVEAQIRPDADGGLRRLNSIHSVLVDQGVVSPPETCLPASEVRTTSPHSSARARIAFVGDGINDAPALSRADISISPCNGSPIALTSSSFILMSASLMAIPELLDISTRVFRRVRFNFAWALVYNVVLVPVAAGVFFKVQEDGWRLGPVWGSLAMALSSVSVVLSSLLLRWEGVGKRGGGGGEES